MRREDIARLTELYQQLAPIQAEIDFLLHGEIPRKEFVPRRKFTKREAEERRNGLRVVRNNQLLTDYDNDNNVRDNPIKVTNNEARRYNNVPRQRKATSMDQQIMNAFLSFLNQNNGTVGSVAARAHMRELGHDGAYKTLIKHLVTDGLITQSGNRRGTKYTLTVAGQAALAQLAAPVANVVQA